MKRLSTTMLSLWIVSLLLGACGSPNALPAAVQATLTALPSATPLPTFTPYPTYTPDPTRPATVGSGEFFDDFSYSGNDDPLLGARGWTVRDTAGGPGVSGATWPKEAISFVDDPASRGNRLAQLAASTAGQAGNTSQAELFQQRKFYEGTYASRVRFSDTPTFGPDGDAVVETFFTITPLQYDLEPEYGEIDFEYLPNGGWGAKRNTLWMTTWETYRAEPWEAVNAQNNIPLSFDGWHTLVVQVSGVRVQYFVDGALLAGHGDQTYPETPLSINYNLWFIEGGLVDSAEERQYIQQVDWLYYAGNAVVSPKEVDQRVQAYRAAGVQHVDQVPAWTPPPVVIPPTPTASVAGPRPFEARLPYRGSIVIDGKLDDWPAEATFTLDQQAQVVYLASGGQWNGPQDLSAQAWAGWSEAGLYLAFRVHDDRLVQEATDASLWQGDYVEVQLDTRLEQDYSDRQLSDDDYQLGFTPGDFGTHPPARHSWQGPILEEQLGLIQQAQTRTEDGYILEIFIPQELLAGLDLREGATLGLNINPSDADSPEAPQKLMMSTSPIRSRTDPTTFGKVTLAK